MGTEAAPNKARRRDIARRAATTLLALLFVASFALPSIDATSIETYAFEKVWWRTDLPVAMNQTNRTWVWGPEPFTSLMLEPYDEGAVSGIEGARWVQYFDKTRVEITRTDAGRNDGWYVTNGLLALEMITGRMQLGDSNHVVYQPAAVNVAGDSDDPNAPTYRSLNRVMNASPLSAGTVVTQVLNPDGTVGQNPDLAGYGIDTVAPGGANGRSIAAPFWQFMNSEGVIYDGFDFVQGPLFDDPYFATGLPITEPYWTTVRVNGEPRTVLIQAFQRRVLTYTPDNPDGWKVEAANVGRHYYRWRYLDGERDPLTVVSAHKSQDLSGNLMFMGEIENRARAAYGEVEMNLKLFDADGVPIYEHRTWLDTSVIEARERLPYQIWTEYSGEFSDYRIELKSRPSHRFHRPALELASQSGQWASNSRYDIAGAVRNNEDRPLDYLQFVIALYNQDGEVTGYRWGMIEPITLQPGQESHFGTSFFDPPRFSDYRIIVTD
jgi:hypothetical protein